MIHKKFKKFGGLVRYDHKNKLIFLNRNLTYNKRFAKRLSIDYPEYIVVKIP